MDNLFKYISKRNEKLTSLSISKIIRRKAEIENIKALNDMLQNEEERIIIVADECSKLQDKQKAEKMIDDYNLFVSLQFFSHNKDCNKRHSVEDGNPFI